MVEKKEKIWTYPCKIILSSRWQIERLTITDHYIKSSHDKHGISNELIRKLMNKLNEIPIIKPKKRHGNRDIYVWERIPCNNNKKYLIVFWFKDDTDNHLWVRNCYPQKLKKKLREMGLN